MMGGFTWGEGGQAVTPDEAKRRREIAAAMLAAGTSNKPIKHWAEGVANVAKGLMGTWEMASIDKAEREARTSSSDANRKALAEALGGAPAATPVSLAPQGGFTGTGWQKPPEQGGSDTYTGAPKGLFASESGGRFDAKNDVTGAGGLKGHFGRVQFGQARLQDAANAGAIPQGTTPEQFMASPELQRAAERWHFADIDKNIAALGVDTSGKQMIGGVPITRDGLAAVAHLGGVGGMRKFVETGGKFNPADANGTRLSDYFSRMGGNSAASPQPQAQPVQVAQASPNGAASIAPLMGVLNNPYSSPGDKVAAQLLLQKKLTAETRDPRDSRLKDLSIQEKEATLAQTAQNAPLDRRQKEIGIQKGERELAGEGAVPLTPDERKSIGVPEGQPAYKTRTGEIKFGPAGTKIVNEAQKQETEFGKETGKAPAKRFDQLATDGDEAAQSMELVAEMRRLGGNISTGAGATVKAYLGKLGIKTEGVSDIEAFNTLVDRLTPQQRVPGSGATSDFDAKMFKGSLPSLMNTPEGNKLILDTVEKISANKIARGDIAMRVQMGELTPRQGMDEVRKLQAEAKAISDQFKPTGKPADKPAGAPAKRPASADPLGLFQ